MIESEKSVSAGEYLGARSRFEPISSEGRAVVFSKDFFWCEPPFRHEQTLASAWVRSIEEMAQGGIFNQYLRDISTLFFGIGSKLWEAMIIEDSEKRKARPPLLSEEGRKLMSLQSKELLDLSSLGRENLDQVVIGMFKKDLEILRRAGVFRLSKIELRTVEENIKEELQRRVV